MNSIGESRQNKALRNLKAPPGGSFIIPNGPHANIQEPLT